MAKEIVFNDLGDAIPYIVNYLYYIANIPFKYEDVRKQKNDDWKSKYAIDRFQYNLWRLNCAHYLNDNYGVKRKRANNFLKWIKGKFGPNVRETYFYD